MVLLFGRPLGTFEMIPHQQFWSHETKISSVPSNTLIYLGG